MTNGILAFRNMKEYDPNKTPDSITEYHLYTDAHITGNLSEGCEPYSFINMISTRNKPGVVNESITLRIGWYFNKNRTYEIKTKTSEYHGGWITDEIAALASLKLGVRLRAGDMTRSFNSYTKDPLGTPRTPVSQVPQLFVRGNQLILPNVVKTVSINNLVALKNLVELSQENYVSLIRAARLYQDALWIAESEPALAWLMLISAIETAANQWSTYESSPISKLKKTKPELAKLLLDHGGVDLLDKVAQQITPSLGATNKFINFCQKFMPEPPDNRPIQWGRIDWSKRNLRKILNKLYEYRSNALHGGLPFPEPMCRPPENISPESVPIEIGSTGLAVHTLGASWESKDLPINMNTFNFMVNGILNKWWDSLTN